MASTGTVVDEVERVPVHLAKILSLLERWEARVSNELDSTKEGHAPKPPLAKQLSDITKASKPIAQELRAWVDKVIEVNQNLSLGDKLKVSLNLIQTLSAGDRYKFYGMVNERERERGDGGIKLTVTKL